MIICPRCGAQLSDDAEFCAVCGCNLKEAWEMQRQIESYEPQKKSGKKWIVVVIVVLILAVTAAAGVFFFRSTLIEDDDREERTERSVDDEEDADKDSGSDENDADKDSKSDEKDTDKDAGSDENDADKDSKADENDADKGAGSDEKDTDKDAKSADDTGQVEEKKALTAADIRASLVDASSAQISEYRQISLVSANASSVVSQAGYDNSPGVAIDGRDETSWQEGVDGYGYGQYLTVSFDGTHDVKYLALKLGNWRSDDYYYSNGRPSRITIQIADFSAQISVPDERREFFIELNEAYPANSVTITIEDVYPGTQWEDTCIAEVKAYGN